MLDIAGKPTESTVPLTAARTMIIHSSAWSVMTRQASRPWLAAAARLETCSSTARGKRSAITPPNSRNATSGIVCAASTWPSAVADPVRSSTAKVSAIPAIIVPRVSANREP